jgi:hypothetical protein
MQPQAASPKRTRSGETAVDTARRTFHEEAKAIANRRFVRQTDTGRRAA